MSEQWHSDAYLRIMSERRRKEKIKHIVRNVTIGGVLAFATAVTVKNAMHTNAGNNSKACRGTGTAEYHIQQYH